MAIRWFGPTIDPVPLSKIRQIPGVSSIISTLYEEAPGNAWQPSGIRKLKTIISESGMELSGIESVNIHDSIKVGLPERDKYIDNYIKTLEALGKEDIHLVCYNFMPVFDWTRSDLSKQRTDGSRVFSYDHSIIEKTTPGQMSSMMKNNSPGINLPGWEPERLKVLQDLFDIYKQVDSGKLFENLVYFLKAVMPVCNEYDINMAIHPDDPPWPVFGLPRIVNSYNNLSALFEAVPDSHNGLTLCTGSLGADPDNDIIKIIHEFSGRIPFVHLRNVRHIAPGKFDECAHLSEDGSLDIFNIIETLYNTGFHGIIRPDHGREIWGESSIPGYGLFDRAIGAAYIQGLWEAVSKKAVC